VQKKNFLQDRNLVILAKRKILVQKMKRFEAKLKAPVFKDRTFIYYSINQ
jgi:hypothetical protein